jgi:DNA invertase Pin-like site-specific DNA recombinase
LGWGSQDESLRVKIIGAYAVEHGITIVKTLRLHGYSASHGTQEPALREAIADIQRGDYCALVVTESSRLDRREDLNWLTIEALEQSEYANLRFLRILHVDSRALILPRMSWRGTISGWLAG